MENLVLDNIGRLMKGNNLTTIANLIGAENEGVAKKGILATASALMSSLSQIASNPVGANGLKQMISLVDPTIANDLTGYLQNPTAGNGTQLLDQFIGKDVSTMVNKITKATKLDSSAVNILLPIVSPIVMSTFSKAIKTEGLTADDLPKFLQDQVGYLRTLTPGLMGFLERIDANDDNSVLDDISRLVDRIFG
jgi:hypothetical protein